MITTIGAVVICVLSVSLIVAWVVGSHLNRNQHRYPLGDPPAPPVKLAPTDKAKPAGKAKPKSKPYDQDDEPTRGRPIVGLE